LIAVVVQAQAVVIVGSGSRTCAQFIQEYQKDIVIEKYYFAWAQGYMVGLLHKEPNTEDMKLLPESFGAGMQEGFIRDYCAKNPAQLYLRAVQALYKRLGGKALNRTD
jgi:hypothetical protein